MSDQNTPGVNLNHDRPPGHELSSDEEGSINQDDRRDHQFECRSCGYVYEPDKGIKKLDIPKNTAFLKLDPLKFRCPVCRSGTDAFKDIGPRGQPSGFQENLKYGFGANSLTPAQKNVLIFGGLALAVSFFLSLYSLR